MRNRCLAGFLILGSLLLGGSAVAEQAPVPQIDALAQRTLSTFAVPGLSVAVVKDGAVVLAKGYGVKTLGESAPVGPETLFGIASNTKAFIAASLAILVDEGKVSWDTRVVDVLPGFAMYDPWVTREMQVRDLLSHRNGLGLGAGDLLFFPQTDFTVAEIVGKLRYIKPATSFRTTYAYSNLGFVTAGEVIRAVTGKGWDEFVRERIFAPVGMTASNASITLFKPGADVVTPHAEKDGVLEPVAWENLDNSGAAGAINSNAADLARWLLVQLDKGKLPGGDARLFSADRSREMWTVNTTIPVGTPPAPLAAVAPHFAGYGLGWFLRDYRGHQIANHGGGLIGLTSRVFLVTDARIGVAVLTNSETLASGALCWSIVDLLLGAPATDWIAVLKQQSDDETARAKEKEAKTAAARAAASTPSLPLDGYAGRYADAWYGEAAIAREGDRLVLRFAHSAGLVGDLEHWQHDTFVARWRDRALRADAYVTFTIDPAGAVAQMTMKPVSALTDFSFDFQDLLFTPAPEVAQSGAK
jgi:CubicO group peptidase (beta-lactamase class C family)